MKKLITIIFITFLSVPLFAQAVAAYNFNNGTASDEIGDNHGLVNGAILTTDRFGNTDHAYYFDGVDDYISLGDSVETSFSGDFSISCWTRISDFNQSSSNNIWQKWKNGVPYSNVTLRYDGYAINTYLVADNNAASLPSPLVTPVLSNDTSAWHHIVVTRKVGGEVILYHNGVAVDTSADISASYTISGYDFLLGGQTGSGWYYHGAIDDVMIYNREITAMEVDSLYNLPNPAPVSVLTIHQAHQIQLFPNPATDYLQLLFSSEMAPESYEIYSMTGQRLTGNQLIDSKEISLSNLSTGQYILILRDLDGKLIGKELFSKIK